MKLVTYRVWKLVLSRDDLHRRFLMKRVAFLRIIILEQCFFSPVAPNAVVVRHGLTGMPVTPLIQDILVKEDVIFGGSLSLEYILFARLTF